MESMVFSLSASLLHDIKPKEAKKIISKSLIIISILFLSEEYLNRNSVKIKMLSQLVLYKPFIRLFNILRQITEESKHRRTRINLRYVFNLDMFPFCCWRRCFLYNRQ